MIMPDFGLELLELEVRKYLQLSLLSRNIVIEFEY
jgi:hypothetical protein